MRTSKHIALLALLVVGCPGSQVKKDDPQAESKEHQAAAIHFDLGVNAQSNGDVRAALKEYQLALENDPNFPEAENALGILYHLSFRQLDESEKHYRKALELKPDFTAARVNLAALYLDQARWDDCIRLNEEALKDLQYKGSYLAANNEGWCEYKKGEVQRGMELISQTVRVNPEFCQGYRNLGLIAAEQGKLGTADEELSRMVKKCPDSAQGWYELGRVQLREKKGDEAQKSFGKCREKAKEGDPILEECAKLAGGTP